MADDDHEYNEEEEEEEEEGQAAEGDQEEAEDEGEARDPLPDPKPFSGEIHLDGVGLTDAAGSSATVKFPSDGSLPAWLLSLVNGDLFYLERAMNGIKPPPAAAAEAEAEEDASGAAVDDAEEEDGDTENTGVQLNRLFALVQESSTTANVFVCRPYVPPPPPDDEDEEGEEDYDDGGAAHERAGESAEAAGDEADDEDDDGEGGHAPSPGTGGAGEGNDEEEEDLAEIVVDGVVLAALCSPESLKFILTPREPAPQAAGGEEDVAAGDEGTGNPDPATSTISVGKVFEFAASRFAGGYRGALDSLLDTVEGITADMQATFPEDRAAERDRVVAAHRPADLTWLFAAVNNRETAADAAAYLRRCTRPSINIVPSIPISAAVLVTTASVNAYVTLLLSMPKSRLVAWSNPIESQDEDDGAPPALTQPDDDDSPLAVITNAPVPPLLRDVLLDLRRRSARAEKGKPPLRQAALEAHAPSIAVLKRLKGGGVAADSLLVTQYAAGSRRYHPRALQLFASDLALLALGRFPESATSFAALLELRMSAIRSRDAAVGFPTALFESIPTVLCQEAVEALVAAADPSWLEPAGLVDIAEWTQLEDLQKAKPDLFAGGSTTAAAVVFARRFGRHLLAASAEPCLRALQSSAPPLYDELRRVEKALAAYVAELQAPTAVCQEALLEAGQAACGEDLTCTVGMLAIACDARNAVGVRFLATRGIAHVQLSSSGFLVGVLEYVVTYLKDTALTTLLVDLGGDLSAPWHGGQTSGLCAVQDVFDAETSAAILDLYRQREDERVRDPRLKTGVLRACLV